jgi:hypothetical protein
MSKKIQSSCDLCVYFIYDEDDECYECVKNLDEDEMLRFLTSSDNNCPYFQLNDEYGRARKQI